MKVFLLILLLLALAILFGVPLIGDHLYSAPAYHGPSSDHFDGKRFHNIYGPPQKHRGFDFFRWRLERFNKKKKSWSEYRDLPPGPSPPPEVANDTLRVTWINHSTVLLQMDGLNILTDPIWSYRASPVSFAGPHRTRSAGIRFENLPRIDAVLISHNHYDHMDVESLARLQQKHRPRVYVGLGNAAFLTSEKIRNVTELDWWQETELGSGVKLAAVPAQHFSSRGLSDRNQSLWLGFVVSGPSGNFYFAGCTGWGTHFEAIGKRYAPLRLALLPIGAFLPRWFMAPVHLSPEEAIAAHRSLGASTSLAIHHSTFALGDDEEDEAVTTLEAALESSPEPRPRFWVLAFGEGREVPPPDGSP